MPFKYPTADDIIMANKEVLKDVRVKKADTHEVLARERIVEILEEAKDTEGDLYDKAVVLLKGLLQKHPFASGNRRTAFVAAQNFLHYNNAKPGSMLRQDARVLQGIRENFYKDNEIKEWLRGGEIHEFKR